MLNIGPIKGPSLWWLRYQKNKRQWSISFVANEHITNNKNITQQIYDKFNVMQDLK